jgi:hypothetical protein
MLIACVFHPSVSPSINAGGAGHRPGLRRGLHRSHGIGLPRSSRRRSPCHGVSIHRHLSRLSPLPFLSGYPAIAVLVCLVLLWWSLHAMALSGPGVCPSGRFVSSPGTNSLHQNGSLGCRNASFISSVSQLLGSSGRSIARWGSRGQAMPIAFVSPKWKQLFGLLFQRLAGSMLQMGG